MLTDEQISKIAGPWAWENLNTTERRNEFARAVEAEATATLLARIAELEKELETERMRLAACGVVAMANTRESAEKARQMHPDYMSASCQDVMRAVDAEIGYRERIAELEADAKRYLTIRNADMDLRNRIEHYSGPALDVFIDNAMKEQP